MYDFEVALSFCPNWTVTFKRLIMYFHFFIYLADLVALQIQIRVQNII